MIRKEKRVRTREEEVVVEKRCDICGKDGLHGWEKGSYVVAETEIRMRTGSSYPEGGSGEEITFDLCTTCFRDKLIPWLASRGAKPTNNDWDW